MSEEWPTEKQLAVLRAFGMRPRTPYAFIAEVQGMSVGDVDWAIEHWAVGDPVLALQVVEEYEGPREQWEAPPRPPVKATPPPALPVLAAAAPEPEPLPVVAKVKATPKAATKKTVPEKKVTSRKNPAPFLSLPKDENAMNSTPTPEPAVISEPDPEPTPEPAAPVVETLPAALVIPTMVPAEPNTEKTETLLARAADSPTHTTRALAAKIRTLVAELDRTLREEADEATLTEEVSRRVSALIAEAERLQAGGLDAMARDWAREEGILVEDGTMVPPMVKLRYLRSTSVTRTR